MTTTRTAVPARTTLHASRPARFVVVTIAIATFGPYVAGSIRTEQLVVYGLLLLFAVVVLSRLHGSPAFLIPWGAYIVVATLGVLFPTRFVSRWEPGDVLAGYDNILLPLAIMLLIWSVVPSRDAASLFATACRIVAAAMAINGLLGIVSIRVDLSPYLRPFWTTADSAYTVAGLAAQLGRYGGIFNQPSEAGALYAIAGLAAIYVWRQRPLLLAVVLGLITIGGLVSVSKIFVLGGLPLILLYWMWSQKRGRKLGLLVGIVFLTIGVLQSGLMSAWTGVNYLARLVNPSGGFLSYYTAGRVGTDSTVSHVTEDLLSVSPFSGIGAGGWAVSYDTAVVEALVTSGIIGLLLYGMILAAMFVLARRTVDAHRRRFAYLFAIVVTGSALGFSPLTGNRVSTIVWLFIALLALCRDQTAVPDGSLQTVPSLVGEEPLGGVGRVDGGQDTH